MPLQIRDMVRKIGHNPHNSTIKGTILDHRSNPRILGPQEELEDTLLILDYVHKILEQDQVLHSRTQIPLLHHRQALEPRPACPTTLLILLPWHDLHLKTSSQQMTS